MGHPCPASDECAIQYNTRRTAPGSGAGAPPKYDHVVETFPSDRADQSLDVRVLPRRSGCSRLVPNAHGTQALPEDHAIRSVSIPNKITRCTVPRKRLCVPLVI